jgi:hypothetical protein
LFFQRLLFFPLRPAARDEGKGRWRGKPQEQGEEGLAFRAGLTALVDFFQQRFFIFAEGRKGQRGEMKGAGMKSKSKGLALLFWPHRIG